MERSPGFIVKGAFNMTDAKGIDIKQVEDLSNRRWFESVDSMLDAVSLAIRSRSIGDQFWVYCVNLYTLGLLARNETFARSYSNKSVAIADGVVIRLLSLMLRWPTRERITGAKAFESILNLGTSDRALKCFFVGSDYETLEKIKARLACEYLFVACVGSIAPPFTDQELVFRSPDFVAEINASGADVLFVALTQPKQEIWLHENFSSLQVPVALGIGAVFDFYAGKYVRAPRMVRAMGAEWVYRIAQSPSKIFQRFRYALPVLVRLLFLSR